ncbi:hypothetical protein N431DRAFT_237842 [Stipitochalara longipes BDJ]|nr:hypothetical protein N431DRAFT_237842 [Stipitochalara longipes BDJ]
MLAFEKGFDGHFDAVGLHASGGGGHCFWMIDGYTGWWVGFLPRICVYPFFANIPVLRRYTLYKHVRTHSSGYFALLALSSSGPRERNHSHSSQEDPQVLPQYVPKSIPKSLPSALSPHPHLPITAPPSGPRIPFALLAIGHNPQSIYETVRHLSDTSSDEKCYVQQNLSFRTCKR